MADEQWNESKARLENEFRKEKTRNDMVEIVLGIVVIMLIVAFAVQFYPTKADASHWGIDAEFKSWARTFVAALGGALIGIFGKDKVFGK